MTIHEIEKQILLIKKENNASGGNWKTDLRYQALLQKKKKINKKFSMEEVFRAKMRDLILQNNVKQSNRLTIEEMRIIASR
jgi:hypothetical protein